MRTRPPARTLERAHQRGHFPLAVAIHEYDEVQSGSGEVTKTLGNAVLSDLACRVAASTGSGQRADEFRRDDGTIAIDARIITLKTYQPTITTELAAVVLDIEWDILAVEHDGQQAFTKLIVEEVT